MDVMIQESDVVRLHRSSKPVGRDSKLVAQTIVKLVNWKIREKVHGVNKAARERKAGFRIHNDLTTRRFQLLSTARDRINSRLSRNYSKEEHEKLANDILIHKCQ